MTSRAFPDYASIPAASVGVGFKPEHAEEALHADHGLGFFEVHAENYMGAGGAPHRMLTELRMRAPLSVHGVALSIGGAGPLNPEHIATTFCQFPTTPRRLPVCQTISTRYKGGFSAASSWRTPRLTSPSGTRR